MSCILVYVKENNRLERLVNKMINNSIIKDYVEDYILNSNQRPDDFDIDVIVENLSHVALVNNMTIEDYGDCDSFPSDDFVEAFEEASGDRYELVEA